MRHTRDIMGMPVTIEVVAPDAEASDALQEAFEYFMHIDAVFSTYKPDSEISRINRGELSEAVASDEVREILAACRQFTVRSDGYFDIRRPDGLDPSGLVKGWAIWNAARKLAVAGQRNYLVSAGGDIQAAGANALGEVWRAGIQHPTQHNKLAKTLRLEDMGLATSGTYERGHHIYDPHTGRPITELISLSVIAPTVYEADLYATAAFARGRSGLTWLQQQGFEGYMVTSELEAFSTPGFQAYEFVA